MDKALKYLPELRKAIDSQEDGHLPLKFRIELYKLINDPSVINKIFFECAKKVYPIWQEEFPNSVLDNIMIQTGEYFKGNISATDLYDIADSRTNYVEEVTSSAGSAGFTLIHTCLSIVTNAATVLNKEDYIGEDDNDFDSDEWTPDYDASIAYSDKIPEKKIKRNLEYWFWFINMVDQKLRNPEKEIVPFPSIVIEEEESAIVLQRTQTTNTPEIKNIIAEIKDSAMQEIYDADENNWDNCIVTSVCFKYRNSYFKHIIEGDESKKTPRAIPSKVPHLFKKLKDLMYKQSPTEGGWFLCNYTFSAYEGDPETIEFYYDEEDIPEEYGVSVDYLIGEFEHYPRSKEFTPKWWQRLLGKKAK